ncbi:MAG: S-adenosylhomocysteine deaminase [Hyphomicrobiales bacterium]|nr:S-adenosylhomocysteine deaminase [Hyphomicrobiales bacterium]
MDADLLLSGGILLPDATSAPIRDGAVAIRDGVIVDIGAAETVAARVQARRVLDCTGQAMMPGLVDTHIHTCQQMARGLADDINVLDWLTRIVAVEGAMDEEDVSISAKAACLEMIKSGTTGFIEACGNPFYIDAMGEAIAESGLRGIMTRSTMELAEPDWSAPDPFVMDAESNLRATRELIEKWHGSADGRISAWCGWRQQWNLSDELLVAVVGIAREYGVGLHGHLATRRYGQIELLDQLGVLGPDMVFAHSIRYTARDRQLIKLNGVNIDHNPGASMHGAYGSAPMGCFPEMVEDGINVCLGCDGAANGNTLDMFQVMRLAATVHKEMRLDAVAISPQDAFKMATSNGAKAAMWPDSGTLKVGNKADVIAVNLMQPHLMPAYNVLNNLVYCASGQDVVTTIVAGRVLMENREVTTFDEARVLSDLQARGEALVQRLPEATFTARS